MTINQIKKALAASYDEFIKILNENNMPLPALTPNQEAILTNIQAHLNKHITLDESVPPDLGCAEAVSFILKTSGVPNLPADGFPGTAALYQFLLGNTIVIQVTEPLPGDVIISPTGTSSKGSPHGHVGLIGQNGLVYSNSSDTGLFSQNYTLASWQAYFGQIEGFPLYYFRWV